MKGKTIINSLLFLFGTFLNLYSQEDNVLKRKNENLINNVKTVTSVNYSIDSNFGKNTKGEITKKEFYSYYSNGILKESYNDKYNVKGTFYGRDKNKYNIAGLLIEEEENSYNETIKIKYNDYGKTTEKIKYEYKQLIEKYLATYNDSGKLLDEVEYDSSGDIISKTIKEYDNNDLLISINYFTKYGKLENKTIYKYNEKGEKTEGVSYDKDGNIEDKWIYKYNSIGNPISMVSKNTAGVVTGMWENKYNNANTKVEYIEISNNSEGELFFKSNSKFDNNGNEIEQVVYLFGRKDVKTYSYDESGRKTKFQLVQYEKNGNLKYKDISYYSTLEILIKSEFHSFENNLLDYKTIANYNDVGVKIDDTFYNSAGSESKTTYEYNNNGDIIEKHKGADKYLYQYACDSKGNWTTCKEIKNEHFPIEIIERTITYY